MTFSVLPFSDVFFFLPRCFIAESGRLGVTCHCPRRNAGVVGFSVPFQQVAGRQSLDALERYAPDHFRYSSFGSITGRLLFITAVGSYRLMLKHDFYRVDAMNEML